MNRVISPQRVWLVLLAILLCLGNQAVYPIGAASIGVTLLAHGDEQFRRPLDATPSPDGTSIYFVARTNRGTPAVFRVPASGGLTEIVFKGTPLVAPHGLVFATNGQTLYVADTSARKNGAVFAISIGDSSIHLVPGTVGLRPRALDLVRQDSHDVLYIAGKDRRTDRAGLWKLVLDGAASSPTPIPHGAPLTTADGIAVLSNGDIFVAGHSRTTRKSDVVFRINNQTATQAIKNIQLGSPAGIALTKDESTLLVSSLAADGTSQVVLLDLATGATSTFNDVIGANRNSGGLHRAHQTNSFAWIDVLRPGRIYRVDP